MGDDDFCDNFECNISSSYEDTCKNYYKSNDDIDCHLFCDLGNCSYTVEFETWCTIYDCHPLPGPTPPPTPGKYKAFINFSVLYQLNITITNCTILFVNLLL
jgi:hypothetical protein